MSLKALVFDMDGTLADSDPLHIVAFAELLAPHGITIDHDFYRARISGRTNAAIFADLFPGATEDEQRRLADEKEASFRRLARTLDPLPGVLRVLDWADERGLGLGLVTNAPPENARHMLESLKVENRFRVRIAGGDVERGKPDPLPYLTAIERLGVGPEEALAFEDSMAGIRAAKSAGIFTIGLTTGQTEAALTSAGADAVFGDFDDPALWRILTSRAGF
jgi:beta-phosphoglucomutase